MKVYGYELTPAQESAAMERMKIGFTHSDLWNVLNRAGVPISYEYGGKTRGKSVLWQATDRLIAREKKAGNIKFCAPFAIWQWVGQK